MPDPATKVGPAELERRIRAYRAAKDRLLASKPGDGEAGQVDPDELERLAEEILAEMPAPAPEPKSPPREEPMSGHESNGHAAVAGKPPGAARVCEKHGEYRARRGGCPNCRGEKTAAFWAAHRAAKGRPNLDGIDFSAPAPGPEAAPTTPTASAPMAPTPKQTPPAVPAASPAPSGLDALAAELDAARAVVAALAPLDEAARRRVVAWVASAAGCTQQQQTP